MKKIYILFLTLIIANQISSQVDVSNRFKTTIPPSPEASAFMKSVNFTDVNFTGSNDIKIDLFDLKLKKLNIPIKLNYSTSGIKVAELASRVGLGWSLEAGGSITRTINGSPDDKYIDESTLCAGSCRVARNTGYILGGLDAAMSFDDSYISSTADELKKSIRLSELAGTTLTHYDNALNPITPVVDPIVKMDTYPDYFYINCLGKTYQMFFSKADINSPLRITTTPYSNYSIGYDINNTLREQNISNPGKLVSNGITQFQITDGDGNIYIFSKIDSLRTAVESGFDQIYEKGAIGDWGTKRGLYMYSTWHLTQIISADKEEINFTYDVETIIPPVQEDFKVRGNTQILVGSEFDFKSYEYQKVQSRIVSHILRRIDTKDLRIEFVGGLAREDLSNSNALTEVIVTSKPDSKVIKHYIFSYDYFRSDGNVIKPGQSYFDSYTVNDLNKRLKLIKIKEVSSSGTEEIAPYLFTYNEFPVLPPLDSKERDFWGYYNKNGAKTLISKTYIYPDYSGILKITPFKRNNYTGSEFELTDGAWNRNCNSNYNYVGMLKQLHYPTGGFEEYTFESNLYENPDWGPYTVGGLRIQQITKKDNNGNTLLNRNYEYTLSSDPSKSSGTLFKFPLVGHIENTVGYDNILGYSGPIMAAQGFDYYKYFLFRQSTPSFTSGNSDNTIVGYSEIAEIINGNNRTIYKFSVPGGYTKTSDVDNTSDCNSLVDGYCDGRFKKPQLKWVRGWLKQYYSGTPLLLGNNPRMNNLELQSVAINIPSQGDFYPYLPSTNYSWNKGLLLSETKYNQSNQKVYEKINTYALPPIDSIFKIPGIYINFEFNDYSLVLDDPRGGGVYDRYIAIYGQFYHLTNVAKLLVTSKERTFSQSNPTAFLEDKKIFTYHNDNRLLKEFDHLKSNGTSIVKKYSYTNSSTTILPAMRIEMLNRNMKDVLVDYEEKYNATNSDLMSNTFSLNALNNSIYLRNIRSSRGGQTTKSSEKSSIDAFNNPLTISENNLSKAYIWDYQSLYPIAEIINAEQGSVGSTSFEADGSGNFIIGSTLRNTSYYITGKKSYDLSNGNITKSGLVDAGNYIVSYWSRNGQYTITNSISVTQGETIKGWTYYEHKVLLSGTLVTISGSGLIDELRLYPAKALVTTFTYEPSIGVTTQCDANNRITYYEYDDFNRLKMIKDKDGSILKMHNYKYQEIQP